MSRDALSGGRFVNISCEQVVAVFVLVLERKTIVCDLKAKSNDLIPLFDIPIAGFVLGKLFGFSI